MLKCLLPSWTVTDVHERGWLTTQRSLTMMNNKDKDVIDLLQKVDRVMNMKTRTRDEIEKEFDKIDRLYHYTSIDTLKKIIGSKSLMFNRNDKVDDLVEGMRTKSFRSYYYISCFTYSDKESIPLWHIYARKDKGVRFSIWNRSFFTGKMYYYNDDKKKRYFNREIVGSEGEKPIYGNIIRTTNGYVQVDSVCRVVVEYSDDKLSIDPTTIYGNSGSVQIRLTNVFDMVGIKGTPWLFEDEARYFTTVTNNQLNINSIFYELDDNFFNGMNITLNPFLSDEESDKTINELKDLLMDYDITLVDSKLKGKVR